MWLDDDDEFEPELQAISCAYHATRLLAHEVDMIKSNGMRPLSANLVSDRIDARTPRAL